MRLQSFLHELTEPLRALVLQHLPARALAAFCPTCHAMLILLDHDTAATWLAAAIQALPKGFMNGLHTHPVAASVQARLQSQAAAEA